ncbi:MAG TPA: NTP transferase domain-containing protein, partial [Stellaceae bacterium]|nr:NTP transferase domain-containing protein [Stellaceae bacterium]
MRRAEGPQGLVGIDAAVLAGGLGTRVAHCLGDLPKAMAPAGGRPFLDHLLDWLSLQGVRR